MAPLANQRGPVYLHRLGLGSIPAILLGEGLMPLTESASELVQVAGYSSCLKNPWSTGW